MQSCALFSRVTLVFQKQQLLHKEKCTLCGLVLGHDRKLVNCVKCTSTGYVTAPLKCHHNAAEAGAYDQVTTYMRPKMLQSWANSINNVGLVAKRSYDWLQRSWVIARGKSVETRSMVMFKTLSHRAYHQVTTYLRSKKVAIVGGQIVERTNDWSQRSYDWLQRSWVIARGKSIATRSMVMFKT